MSKTTGYLVKCKCRTVRCETWNEWLSSASSLSYVTGRFTGLDGRVYDRNADFRCETCGRYFKVTEIRGTVTSHKCNAKCLASTSGKCECACGGKNHGHSYA